MVLGMSTRNLTLDCLKVILAVMVVALHGSLFFDLNLLLSTITSEGLFRCAVPVFLIINGFYFANIQTQAQLFKWLKRVFTLYAVWMAFYSFAWLKLDFTSIEDFYKLLIEVFFGYHHLWYLVAILGAGLLTYVLRSHQVLAITIIIICYITGVSIQYIGNYHLAPNQQIDVIFNTYYIHRNFLLFGLPFFYIGFLIHTHYAFLEAKLSTKTLMVCLGLSLIILMSESWLNSMNPFNDGSYDNYGSLILASPLVVLLALRSKQVTTNKNYALTSNAIYFIHPFFISITKNGLGFEYSMMVVFTVILSFIAAYFLIKIHKRFHFIL